jgi:antirestriction protein
MTTTQQHTEPTAWIGCLACYNNGTLRGKWITARQAADDIAEAERTDGTLTYAGQAEPATYPSGTTYARCVVCGGDEFDVFDTEHVPDGLHTLAEFYNHADILADLDDDGTLERINVLAGWLSTDKLENLIAYDADNYAGQFDTFQDYAEQYVDDTGLLAEAGDLANYFDYEKFARDLEMDYYYDQNTGHTWRSV